MRVRPCRPAAATGHVVPCWRQKHPRGRGGLPRALADPLRTTVALVARPEASALTGADRAGAELAELGIANQQLVVNGLLTADPAGDGVAAALEQLRIPPARARGSPA